MTEFDYRNKHTWSIYIMPQAEIQLQWIMTRTKQWLTPLLIRRDLHSVCLATFKYILSLPVFPRFCLLFARHTEQTCPIVAGFHNQKYWSVILIGWNWRLAVSAWRNRKGGAGVNDNDGLWAAWQWISIFTSSKELMFVCVFVRQQHYAIVTWWSSGTLSKGFNFSFISFKCTNLYEKRVSLYSTIEERA